MQFRFILPAAALALAACSTTTSGGQRFFVGEGATPRPEDAMPRHLEQLTKEWKRNAAPGMLVVGDVGALHKAESPGFAGWTSIETFGLAGFVQLERPAAVRQADAARVGFAPPAAALFGSTGDLVAARAGADGLLVLDRVLCQAKAEDFRACIARYARGHFDQAGAELDGDLQPRRGGRRIDPATYALLPQGGAQ